MILTIDIKDSVADKILYFLDQFKSDIKILDNDIEEIKEGNEDYKYILEAREARKNGEKIYSLDDVLKEIE